MWPRMRVMVADDHAAVRTSLRDLVEFLPWAEVVGEANDGEEAVKIAGKLRPDVVLMDVCMPRLDGFDASAQICREVPGVRVLLLSVDPDPRGSVRALAVGAVGLLRKDLEPEELWAELARIAGLSWPVVLPGGVGAQSH